MQLKMALECYLVFNQYYSKLFITIPNIYPGIHHTDVRVSFQANKDSEGSFAKFNYQYKLLVKRLNSL